MEDELKFQLRRFDQQNLTAITGEVCQCWPEEEAKGANHRANVQHVFLGVDGEVINVSTLQLRNRFGEARHASVDNSHRHSEASVYTVCLIAGLDGIL